MAAGDAALFFMDTAAGELARKADALSVPHLQQLLELGECAGLRSCLFAYTSHQQHWPGLKVSTQLSVTECVSHLWSRSSSSFRSQADKADSSRSQNANNCPLLPADFGRWMACCQHSLDPQDSSKA